MASRFMNTKAQDTSRQKLQEKQDTVSTDAENLNDVLFKWISKVFSARVSLERLPGDVMMKYTSGTDGVKMPASRGHVIENPNESLVAEVCPRCEATSSFHTPAGRRCKKCRQPMVYRCGKCRELFKSRSACRYHLAKVCSSHAGFFHCLKCNYKSVWKYHVKRHVKTVHAENSNNFAKYIAFRE